MEGLTALHFACYCGASSEVVELLLGDSHKALHHIISSEESIDSNNTNNHILNPSQNARQKLFKKKSAAASYMRNRPRHSTDQRGRTPLHCACAGFRTKHRPAVIHALLQKDPFTTTLADEKGRTPFSLLYDDYAEDIEEVIHPSVDTGHARDICLKEGGALWECFQILVLLLRAEYLGHVEEDLNSALEISELMWIKNSTAAGISSLSDVNMAVIGSSSSSLSKLPAEEEKKLADSPGMGISMRSLSTRGSMSTSGGEVDLTETHFRLIHAASSSLYTFPHGFFQLLLKVCGEARVKEHDSDFHLPLHLAARARPPPSAVSANVVSPNRYSISTSFHGQSATLYEEKLGLTLRYYPDMKTHKNKQYTTTSFQPAESLAFHQTPIISHLLDIYPGAASIPDDRGKYPVLMAIESGKSYDYVIEPLLDAFPNLILLGSISASNGLSSMECTTQDPGDIDAYAGIEAVHASLMLALTHPSIRVRNETAVTVGLLMKRVAKGVKDPVGDSTYMNVNPKYFKTDEFIRSIIRTSGRYGSVNARRGDSSDDDSKKSTNDEWAGVQATMLQALSASLSNITPIMIQIPETPQLALDVAKNMLKHDDITVRECAACCIGTALEFLDEEVLIGAVSRVVLPQRRKSQVLSGSLHSMSSTSMHSIHSLIQGESNARTNKINSDNLTLVNLEDAATRNGRALAAFRIMTSSKGDYVALNEGIFDEVTQLMQALMLDDEAIVRESASLAMGAILGLCSDTPATLKEVRHTILKCMRTTEDLCVQIAVARGLMVATRMKPHVFICKAATPILEGALLLAVSSVSPVNVQKMYHGFLWLALGIGDKESAHYGLSEYMAIADGENGKIMMSLVTKTLAKIESVRDILWSSTVYCEDEISSAFV